MLSNAKMQRLFAYLVPHLRHKTKAELDSLYSDLERMLGYDAARAARYRRDAKERDAVMDALTKVRIRKTGEAEPPAPTPAQTPARAVEG